MKTNLFFTVVFVLTVILLSCSKQDPEFNQQNLLGKWTLIKAVVFNSSNDSYIDSLDFPANMICLTFRSDGTIYSTYDVDLDNTIESQDTSFYKISTFNGKDIIIISYNSSFNPSDSAEIVSFSSNYLKWNTKIDKVNDDNNYGTLYHEYEFQKIE